MKIILASTSPRRKQLLGTTVFKFKVVSPTFDEILDPDMDVYENVMTIAYEKAKSVLKDNQDSVIIGADTVVAVDGDILGKPVDEADALRMLQLLNNKKHSVITGVAILTKDSENVFFEESIVQFKDMPTEMLTEYIATKEPLDKAGAYAIQGLGQRLVVKYDGDLENIIGLPVYRIIKELDKLKKK